MDHNLDEWDHNLDVRDQNGVQDDKTNRDLPKFSLPSPPKLEPQAENAVANSYHNLPMEDAGADCWREMLVQTAGVQS